MHVLLHERHPEMTYTRIDKLMNKKNETENSSKKSMQVFLYMPPKLLGANINRSTVSDQIKITRARKEYRRLCAYAFQQKFKDIKTPIDHITIYLEYYCWKGNTEAQKYARQDYYFPRDEMNGQIGFKAGQDALIDAGVITDDSARHVCMGGCKIYSNEKEHKRKTGLMVTIEWEEK